jgi:hypothetical protein
VYDIPLRSLYSRNIPNLMMAGRNISATHTAFTSARVMATCAVIGQAVGTAAAQCVETGMAPRELAKNPQQLSRLQETLLRDDQTIKGRRNQDPRDLARQATVTASAEAAPAKAALVIDGFVRDIPDNKGRPVEVHHWAAPVGDGRTAWIQLQWPTPQRIGHVQITFDTGFQRQLTLTSQDAQNIGIVRAPQPETVKDYSVTYKTADGKTHDLATVKDNFQRLNRHHFDPVEAQSLRVEVRATNGSEEARVFEIRCYA